MSKEIIIDGVNVAECEFFDNGEAGNACKLGYWTDVLEYSPNCDCNPDCYFKQLQRAKAELEQYKKSKQASYETMQEQWNNAVNELRDLKASDKIEFKQYYKTENERLKAENEKLKAMTGVYSVRLLEKYKQALEDIKNINNSSCINKVRVINATINEVLNERI